MRKLFIGAIRSKKCLWNVENQFESSGASVEPSIAHIPLLSHRVTHDKGCFRVSPFSSIERLFCENDTIPVLFHPL